jgi:hypothetical protein
LDGSIPYRSSNAGAILGLFVLVHFLIGDFQPFFQTDVFFERGASHGYVDGFFPLPVRPFPYFFVDGPYQCVLPKFGPDEVGDVFQHPLFSRVDEEDEFIPSEPAHPIVFPYGSLQYRGDFPEHLIASGVSQKIVDRFEVVDVDIDDRKRPLFRYLVEIQPVVNPGKRILVGLAYVVELRFDDLRESSFFEQLPDFEDFHIVGSHISE